MSTETDTPHPEYDDWVWNGSAATQQILELVMAERHRQVRKYGLNRDIVDGTGPNTRWLLPYTPASAVEVEQELREDYEDFEADTGLPTWVHLLREELAEAFAEDNPERLEAELIQVVALGVSWLERLRERRAEGQR